MSKARKLLLLPLLLWGLVIQAQTRLITGKVGTASGPIAGASVTLSGGEGTTTDDNGSFSLRAPSGNVTITVSSVGYTEVKQNLSASQNDVEIILQQSDGTLNEVVVTALGIRRSSRSLVYATQTVKSAELAEVRDPNNILNNFQGKVANAFITQSSGGVGSGAKIILRGNKSIQGNNSALIVIDGVPIYNTQFDNMASNINPDDIESTTILKGASAAALYGSQAGNGVIVITTKKGSRNRMSVTLNSGLTLESPFALPRVQNKYGQGIGGVLDVTKGDSWGAELDGRDYTDYHGNPAKYTAQPDNIKDFFRTGINLNNSIGVSGGSDKMQGYLSYTNNHTQGIIPNNDLLRHTLNARLSNQITKRLSTDFKVTYFTQNIQNRPRNGEGNTPVLNIYQIPRNVPTASAEQYEVMDELGTAAPAPWPATLGPIYGNPYWSVNKDNLTQKRDQVLGFLTTKFEFTPWLSITGRANLDRSYTKAEQKTAQGTLLWATNPGGYYSVLNAMTTQKWLDVILSGENNLSKDFKINYNVGAIYQNSEFSQTLGVANGLNVANKFSLNFATKPVITQAGTEVETQSVFGQANFSFRDAIYLDASLRNDWDSRLRAPHSFQYYSLGMSAILSDLVTMPDKISFLKASINYAEVGNGGQFGLLSARYNYSAGVGNGYLFRSDVLPFPELQPEIVKNLEAGLEANFFDNRLGFNFAYYKANSFNQLLTISIPVATGYATQYINAGNIQNNGIELVLNGTPVKNENLTWDVSFNLGINRNKVKELTDEIEVVNLGSYMDWGGVPRVKVGGSYGDIVSYVWEKDENGNYLVQENGKPLTSGMMGLDPKVIGNFNPKALLGLSNSFNYKNFSFRFLIDGRVGGIMISGTEMNLAFSGITEGTEEHRDGNWNLGGVDVDGKPVTENISAQDFWQTASGKRFGVGDFFTYDATNFRMRELSLGYSIPLRNPTIVKKARLSLVARNLFWLYRGSSKMDIPGLAKRKMWLDPDVSQGNGNNFNGIEYGAFPSTRSVGVNLNLTF